MDQDREVLEKCQVLYRRVAELEKELEMHKDRAKDTQKRIDGYESEIRHLITNPGQLELVPSDAGIEAEATQ